MTATMFDADTHVLESEATWDQMDPGDRHLRPLPVESIASAAVKKTMWLVGAQRMKRPVTPTNGAYAPGVQDLSDVPARLAAMDDLGIDVNMLMFCCWAGRSGGGDLGPRLIADAGHLGQVIGTGQ